MTPKISVILMAFDEAESIESTCDEIMRTLDAAQLTAEMVVIDDGSTDGTRDAARGAALKDPRIRVVEHAENLGLGYVYRRGFREARGEYLTFYPADGQFPASIITAQFERAERDALDLVLGYIENRQRPLLSRTLSSCEKILFRILFGPLPKFQGVFLARTERIKELEFALEGRGWAVVFELLVRAKALRWRTASVPTPFRPRGHGRSKVNTLRSIVLNVKMAFELRISLWREALAVRRRGVSERNAP